MLLKKAHLNGVLQEDEHAYIELRGEAGQEGKRGRLKRLLYGMRQAASAWERSYSEELAKLGLRKGVAAPTVFYAERSCVRCVADGNGGMFGRKACFALNKVTI